MEVLNRYFHVMTDRNADYWIEKLKLLPHPEGGFYRETYRATESISHDALPRRFSGERQHATAIYFLLRAQDRSHFHRIQSDELWHYHAGGALSIFLLSESGVIELKLGTDIDNGESPQVVVPAGKWFGAFVKNPGDYTLSSCTVSPGFDFEDFEMADRDLLLQAYPAHHDLIVTLTTSRY